MEQRPVATLRDRLAVSLLFLTVGLAGFLAFIVQPLAAKLVLPRFGGGAEVWSAAMTTLGVASGAGFFGAWLLSLLRQHHWAVGIVIVGWSAALAHALAVDRTELDLAGYLLPFAVGVALLIMVAVLLPYWFAGADAPHRTDPYLAYAFSLLGGTAGLIGYPLVLEPHVTVYEQQRLWSVGCLTVVLGFLGCAALVRSAPGVTQQDPQHERSAVREWARRIRWIALAAIPGLLLLVSSPELTDVFSATPVVWLLPVSVLQLTLVHAFTRFTTDGRSFVSWGVQTVAALICLAAFAPVSAWVEWGQPTRAAGVAVPFTLAFMPHRWTLAIQSVLTVLVVSVSALQVQIEREGLLLLQLAMLAATCWGCHGEMLADRPNADRFVEFLFFTGIAATAAAQVAGWAVPSLPGAVVVPSLAGLAILARVAGRVSLNRADRPSVLN